MGLGSGQDPSILEVANMAADKAFRLVIDSLEVDTATGIVRVQGTGPGGSPIQATHLDMAFPYGHYSLPPTDVEAVAVPGAVRAVVLGTRDPELPADLKPGGSQALASGDSVQYARGGAYARYSTKGRLGAQGSVTPAGPIARDGDPVSDAGGALAAWAAVVEAAFVAPLPPFPPASSWALVGPILGSIADGSPNWDCD